jgi:hypothetical protein
MALCGKVGEELTDMVLNEQPHVLDRPLPQRNASQRPAEPLGPSHIPLNLLLRNARFPQAFRVTTPKINSLRHILRPSLKSNIY